MRTPYFSIVGECHSVAEAVDAIAERDPELVFLDIGLPDGDGFDVIRKLDTFQPPIIVFLTAYCEHALRAFEVNALDYLLKPIDNERFRRTLERVREQVEHRRAGSLSQQMRDLLNNGTAWTPHKHLERFLVPLNGRLMVVPTVEVDWIAAADDYVVLHCGSREFLIREKLAHVEAQLDPAEFVRIHRSTIVRKDQIRELHPLPNREGIVRLKGGAELRLSRSFRDHLESVLRQP
jgi:two-component system LytT family response regulator